MQEHDDADERLVAELRELFAQADPVPSLVTEVAKASLGWRRLDAELAELLTDSVLEADSLATARGGEAVRSVTFGTGAKTLDVEVHSDGERRALLGQIAPPASACIEIQSAERAPLARVQSDDLGRFAAQLPAGGLVRMIVLRAGPGSSAQFETSWITI